MRPFAPCACVSTTTNPVVESDKIFRPNRSYMMPSATYSFVTEISFGGEGGVGLTGGGGIGAGTAGGGGFLAPPPPIIVVLVPLVVSLEASEKGMYTVGAEGLAVGATIVPVVELAVGSDGGGGGASLPGGVTVGVVGCLVGLSGSTGNGSTIGGTGGVRVPASSENKVDEKLA